jgi:hypothetical protein
MDLSKLQARKAAFAPALIAIIGVCGCQKAEQAPAGGGQPAASPTETQPRAAAPPVREPFATCFPGEAPAWYSELAKEAASADFRKGDIKPGQLAWALVPDVRALFAVVQVESVTAVDARVRMLKRDDKTGAFTPGDCGNAAATPALVSHVPASVLLKARTVRDQLINVGNTVGCRSHFSAPPSTAILT